MKKNRLKFECCFVAVMIIALIVCDITEKDYPMLVIDSMALIGSILLGIGAYKQRLKENE